MNGQALVCPKVDNSIVAGVECVNLGTASREGFIVNSP